jgi:hypothetical protein
MFNYFSSTAPLEALSSLGIEVEDALELAEHIEV